MKSRYLLFALVGAVVVLWQMLLPGYVLLLDWTAGPQNVFSYHSLADVVSAPSGALLYLLRMFLPAWVVQKFVLIGMFFILFYFPLRFYPVESVKSKVEIWKYFASLLFVFNPFVYERMLAGQWRVIVGYAFLFPLIYYLLRFSRERSWRAIFGVFGTLLVVGMWSVHFLVIGVIVIGMYFLVLSIRYLREKHFDVLRDVGKKFFATAMLFGLISGYWVVPYVLRDNSTLAQFTSEHQIAFATATDEHIGVVGNVLAMRGFWGEDHAWVKQFVMPWSNVLFFYGAFLVIVFSSFAGVRFLWWGGSEDQRSKIKDQKWNAIFLIVLFVSSVVFASGISAHGIWWINQWLFDNVGFWSGFRDSQKWTGVSVFVYALTASLGVRAIVQSQRSKVQSYVMGGLLLLLPILFVPQMLFGLNGQLRAVWHPQSWQEVNIVLRGDDSCKAIFLPWHQYYAVQFNDGMLTGNPSHRYFDCDVIAGHNTELGDIKSTAGNVDDYHAIEAVVATNDASAQAVERVIDQLRASDIEYIIFSHDLGEKDLYKYPFLDATEIQIIFETTEITLYKVK